MLGCVCMCDTEVKSVDRDNEQCNICKSSVYMHVTVCVLAGAEGESSEETEQLK